MRFASRCKAIHGWYDLNGLYHIAYLCEANLYVDIGGDADRHHARSAACLARLCAARGRLSATGSTTPRTYGTPAHVSTIAPIDKVPDAWSLDNFGSILYAMTTPDGRLLKWDPAAAAGRRRSGRDPGHQRRHRHRLRAAGPMFVVTPERFVMIFGMIADGTTGGGSFRRFGWCDQENSDAWNFSDVTSQAGFLDIEPASPIVSAMATRNGILFWTGKKAYVSQFLGAAVHLQLRRAGQRTARPGRRRSLIATSSMTLWMSKQGMFSYDGTSIAPVACLVRPWVDDDIDQLNVREQACAVHVADFSRVLVVLPAGTASPTTPAASSTTTRKGGGRRGRCRARRASPQPTPSHTIMADGLVAFEHEAGRRLRQRVPLPFAETFDLNLTSGARLITVKQMIPDVGGDVANLLYSLFYRNQPQRHARSVTGLPVPASRSSRRRCRCAPTATSTSAPPAATSACASRSPAAG